MESYHNVLLTISRKWKPSDLDDDGQWYESDNNASFGANVSATSYTQSDDVLDSILSASEHKPLSITFSDDLAFTKGATDDELFFDIPELDTREFDNYDGFSTSPVVFPFVTNYIYATTNNLIYSSFSITNMISDAYTITSLVRYWIHGQPGRN